MIPRPPWLCGVVLAIAGCNTCHEDVRSIQLSGEVVYPEYTSGQIVVVASESESIRCADHGEVMGQTPGEPIGQVTLEQPGTFSLSGQVWGIGSFPQVNLRVFVTTDPVGLRDCSAGAMLTLSPTDATNLSLRVETGRCYYLL
jgi:hypothetical protein